jgi:hypothetical protein
MVKNSNRKDAARRLAAERGISYTAALRELDQAGGGSLLADIKGELARLGLPVRLLTDTSAHDVAGAPGATVSASWTLDVGGVTVRVHHDQEGQRFRGADFRPGTPPSRSGHVDVKVGASAREVAMAIDRTLADDRHHSRASVMSNATCDVCHDPYSHADLIGFIDSDARLCPACVYAGNLGDPLYPEDVLQWVALIRQDHELAAGWLAWPLLLHVLCDTLPDDIDHYLGSDNAALVRRLCGPATLAIPLPARSRPPALAHLGSRPSAAALVAAVDRHHPNLRADVDAHLAEEAREAADEVSGEIVDLSPVDDRMWAAMVAAAVASHTHAVERVDERQRNPLAHLEEILVPDAEDREETAMAVVDGARQVAAALRKPAEGTPAPEPAPVSPDEAAEWLPTRTVDGAVHAVATHLDVFDGYVHLHLAPAVAYGGGVAAHPDLDEPEPPADDDNRYLHAAHAMTLAGVRDAAAEVDHIPHRVRNAPMWSPAARCGLQDVDVQRPDSPDDAPTQPCPVCFQIDDTAGDVPQVELPDDPNLDRDRWRRHQLAAELLHALDADFQRGTQRSLSLGEIVSVWLGEPLARGAALLDTDGRKSLAAGIIDTYRRMRRNEVMHLLHESLLRLARHVNGPDDPLEARLPGRPTETRSRALRLLDRSELDEAQRNTRDGLEGALNTLGNGNTWAQIAWVLWATMELDATEG